MGMDIYFFKTKHISEKNPNTAYYADLDEAKLQYKRKCDRLLKKLDKALYYTEEYKSAYSEFLANLKKYNERIYLNLEDKPMMCSEWLRKYLMCFMPLIPKSCGYFRKYYFIYDFCLERNIITEANTYGWVSRNTIEEAIEEFSKKYSDTYYFSEDDMLERKEVVKVLKHINRFLKSDEKVYVVFS